MEDLKEEYKMIQAVDHGRLFLLVEEARIGVDKYKTKEQKVRELRGK